MKKRRSEVITRWRWAVDGGRWTGGDDVMSEIAANRTGVKGGSELHQVGHPL
jgi:hypothetical protein